MMHRKINVFINGEYTFSTNAHRTCKEVIQHIRAVKHIEVASLPKNRILTVNDYDKIRATYAR